MPTLNLTGQPQELVGTEAGTNYALQSQGVGLVLVAADSGAPTRGFRLFPNAIQTFRHESGEALWVWATEGRGRLVWAEAAATGGGGGGGLVLRNPVDRFTGSNLAACRLARNNFFSASANSESLAEFQASQFLAIVLDPTGDDNSVFETYSTGQEGQRYDATQWLERTGVVSIKGDRGEPASTANIDARIATLVAAQALAANTDRWPIDKIPAIADIMAAIDAAIGNDWRTGGSGGGEGGSGITEAEVTALIARSLTGYRTIAQLDTKTANYQIAATDRGDTIALTGSGDATFTVPSPVPAGWWCVAANAGSGTLTINSGATNRFIGSAASFELAEGESVHLQYLGLSSWLRIALSIDGGGGADATARAQIATLQTEVEANTNGLAAEVVKVTANIQAIQRIDRAIDNLGDLQSVSVSTAGTYENALTTQQGSAKPLLMHIGAAIRGNRQGAAYEWATGAILWIPPTSVTPELLFTLPSGGGGADATARATANRALARTSTLRPVSQWVHLGGAQTVFVEWKPATAVANGAALGINFGGTNIAGITSPEAISATDTQGTVIPLAISAGNAGSVDRAANTIAGHIEIQLTHGGNTISCWMGIAQPRIRQLANEAAYTAITSKRSDTIYWWP